MTARSLSGMLALCWLGSVTALANGGEIRWRSGTAVTPAVGPADASAQIAAVVRDRSGGGGSDRPHIVVQFGAPLSAAERDELAAGGVTLLTYLGDHAFFASVSPEDLDTQKLATVRSLRAAMPIQQEWKLHPSLVDDEVMPWAVVDQEANEAIEGHESAKPVSADDDPMVAAYVLLHADMDLATDGATVLGRHQAAVRSTLYSINGYVIELPYSEIKPLADEEAVQYIEPPLPGFAELNNSNRELTGANLAQDPPYNLDGTGVTVLVYDGGTVLSTHPDLTGRVRIGDTDGLSDHSTHVAGTIGGDGSASSGLYRGMAPGVLIESYGFETGGPLEAGFLYTDPGDIEQDYNDSINNHGADISNNSIGTNVAPNGFPCSWEGDYGATSALIDAIVRGSLGAPFRIVWANGNERGDGSCGTMYHTTAPPACAKNHIAVGALNSNDDSVTYFTSWGPADDGRLKPDVSAPGCQTNDDMKVTSCSSAGGYAGKCGTSMASPTVAGLSALLLQDYRIQYPGDPDFRNSTLKSLLAHTAVDLENPGPDYRSGYGSVRIVPAIEQMRSGYFMEDEVDQGEVVQVLVVVSPSDTELRVTLAWDDVPGTPNVDPALVNDLDLRVYSPSLVQYYPWTLDPNNPQNDAVRTQADHVNNIEQVVIDAPAPGSYLVEIVAFNVPEGPQPFSLVASPQLIKCSTIGSVFMDRVNYACTSIATITVNDCDLNTNGAVVETIQIPVTSTSEPTGEVITLTETGPETALFVGTLPIATVNTNGVLMVTAGDMITATYIDADDGFGGTNITVHATAGVDCTDPVISNVTVAELEPQSARVEFNTDELATGMVHYGTSCGSLTETAGAAGVHTAHSIVLHPLVDDTPYFYSVEAADEAGNGVVDDNGGACYTFTTPQIPDYFTQQFTGGIDLANRTVLFAPNGSVDFYEACIYETLILPTDPAGGTTLYLTDTATATLQLTGGHEILLYGSSYSTLYVNANGNITFDSADSDSTETYDEHFASPRISALYDDLDPSEGGEVSWKELGDRVVVTWFEVPEDNGNNDNTFQIEMFYDGRIQMTWLGIDAADGIVGLSQGLGTPLDFIPSDLSEFEDCGPRAPSAAGRTVVLGQDREAQVTLLASDDGLPDPPAALTYVITSLPDYALRDAGNAYVIQEGDVPYTLTGGGNQVIYTPAPGFVGEDSFDFKANDGGTPPKAGDSNVATVVLDVDPVLTIPFFDDFPTTTFDEEKWATITTTTIDGGGIDEPSPPYSARCNGFPTGGDSLISHLIDISSLSAGDVRLIYSWERTGTGESPDSGDNFYVEYVNTNGVWELLRQFAGDGNDMTSYVQDEIVLPAEAMHDSFRVRFRSKGSASSSSVMDDWFVDDVIITHTDAPLASGGSSRVHKNETVNITLTASDPNEDPLDYIISALPEHGVLVDPGAGPIDLPSLPYVLVAGGNVVQYQPETDFVGSDAFSFKANDGVYDSNEASIVVGVEPVLSLPFEDYFAGLTLDTLKWADTFGTTIDNVGLDEPSEPYSARFNGDPENGDVLETFDIDLEGYTGIRLQYYWQRTGGGESPDAGDDLTVEYLDNTLAWQVLAVYAGDGEDMTYYQLVDVPLPVDALHGEFRIRFSNSATAGVVDDWFIDDVRVYSEDAPSAFDQSVAVPKFGGAVITLEATDPNEDPLDFTIYSLPATGELRDIGGGGLIESLDLPHTLVGGGDSVLYLPPLAYEGAVHFSFRARDAQFDSNEGTVSIQIGGLLAIHSFLFDSDPGWSTEGLWEFGVPQGPQGLCYDPTSGATGPNVYGYNLDGCYENDIATPYYLTTPALDCSSVTSTELQFQRWLGVEDADFDHASVEISVNGADWGTVWEHTGGNINDTEWNLQTFDISSIADGESAVQVRWGMGPSDEDVGYQGWNIDDVKVLGNFEPGPGDIDGDGDADLIDFRAFSECLSGPGGTPYPPVPMTAEDCRGPFDFDVDGDVDLDDFAEFMDGYTG